MESLQSVQSINNDKKQEQQMVSEVEANVVEVDELTGDSPQQIMKLSRQDSKNLKPRIGKKMDQLIALKCEGINFKEAIVEKPSDLTVGLDDWLDLAWTCIMEVKEVPVICVHGMDGVGKTTFLREVNKKFMNTAHDFDVVIWVDVSPSQGLEQIQEDVLGKLGFSDEQLKHKSVDEKAQYVLKLLHKSQFVLMLDELWKPVDLAKIGVRLPAGGNRSKVIFTTSTEDVILPMNAKLVIRLSPLTWKHSWKLFKKNVGDETLSADPAIPALAKAIAKACRGLPLVLIAVARAMAYKVTPKEWRNSISVLARPIPDLQGVQGEVHSVLKFCYDSLPDNRVRSCFLYCSLFPRSFRVLKDDLINYWICEKFWEGYDDGDDADNQGYHTIDTLVYACLLEDEGRYVKMHNLIHEFASVVAVKIEKTKDFVQAGLQLTEAPEIGKWEDVRRMSLVENSIKSLTEVPICPDLSTLFLSHNRQLFMITDGFFQSMTVLTALDLSNTCVEELPIGVSKLVSLQYLNLSSTRIEELPVELKMLVKLKCLNLEHNDFLRKIPRQVIHSLLSLQVLRMFRCDVSLVQDEDNLLSLSNTDVEELQRLEHLNILSFTITSAAALKSFCESSKLTGCTKALSLKCPWGSKSLNLSCLENMKNLDSLEVCRSHHLEELNVDFKMEKEEIKEPARFLSTRSFNSLREVIVEKCSLLQDLTWLVLLAPNLKVLRVTDCRDMEEIVSKRKSDDVSDEYLNPLAKLEILVLEKLPQLKSVHWKPLPFPCLKKIFDCPMLKNVPQVL